MSCSINADRLVQMPKGLDVKVGAAAMLQGMTAHYLAYTTYPLKPGERLPHPCCSRGSGAAGWIAAGKLTLRMEHNFALRDAAQAHASLEGRQTTGKVLLIP